jgi:hypothetical protein
MRVTHIKLETFMLKISRTRDVEVGCDDCFKQSAHLIEALTMGNVEDEELLNIVHHLLQCLPCSQEFQVLQDCARMDAEDSWPSMDEMRDEIESKKNQDQVTKRWMG